MKQLMDRAMFWDDPPRGQSHHADQVKGSTVRDKILLLTTEQVKQFITALALPYSLMVLVSAILGLRVEEVLALQWDDLDWANKTITIKSAFTHSRLKEPKSEASWATLPIADSLLHELKASRNGSSVWVFPSPVTGRCYSGDTILQKKIKPVVAQLGLPHMGWHNHGSSTPPCSSTFLRLAGSTSISPAITPGIPPSG